MNKDTEILIKKCCANCKSWQRLGVWWGRCTNENRTAIETNDPGSGPEMTRQTFGCSAFEHGT